jgi:flagellar biosynthesis/type III secretory pathway protein FliH
MDKTSLENAIRNEAEQQVLSIARKEAEEIKGLDDAHAAGIDDFRKHIQDQTDERIRLETSRMENRANLDLKKHKIRSIESFISSAVEEAVKTIRDNPLYRRFLLDAIVGALGKIPAGAEIHLEKMDLAFEKDIRTAIKAAGATGDITIMEDSRIRWGGCIIVDVSGGRVFDSTIERSYFRRSLLIRREAMGLLGDSSGDAVKESSCKIQ